MNHLAKRKTADNESVFRTYNEKIQRGNDELMELAKRTNQEDLLINQDHALSFLCECSDEDCRERIRVRPITYAAIHTDRSRFIVKCGHEVPEIERVVDTEDEYCIVEKNETPGDHLTSLNPTDVDNV